MTIKHREGGNTGMFFIEDEKDNTIAEIVYDISGSTLVIEHTEVDESLRGKNIGYELVHRTVEYARMHRLKIAPVCPFAKAIFDKEEDWKDLLA